MSAPRRSLYGIRTKLLVSFSVLVASIALFVFAFFPARLERQAMRLTVAKAEAVRDMAAYTLSAGLVFNDTAAIDEVLAGVAQAHGVMLLVVRDQSGYRIASFGGDSLVARAAGAREGITRDGRMYVTSAAVTHAGTPVGHLTLGVSLADLRAEVRGARKLGVLVGGLIILVGLLIVYAISTLVTRPLSAVSDTVRRIANGDLTMRAVGTSDVEVAQFVTGFNHMVDSLVGAQAELSSINQELEARVDVRTSELREAVAAQQRVQGALAQSEAEARASSETLQTLFDLAPQVIITVDLEWRVTRWNKAAEDLFGWTAAEVIGRPIPYIPDDQRAAFDAHRLRMVDTVSPPMETVRCCKDGRRVSVLVSGSILRDHEQQPTGYIAVVSDLTERKSLEDQLRQSQKMEAIGRLAGGVAHDFNNILTVITSSTALLQERERDDEDREELDAIAASAMRAAALTRQLLMFSRKQPVNLRPLNLNDVVHNMGPMLRRLLRANIQFNTGLGSSLAQVTADPSQLEQVILNLVVNASDAMPMGGRLSVETTNVELDGLYAVAHADVKAGNYVQLSVTDTGVGMDSATIEKIFEPFFTTKGVGQGTGLGLATTYAVVTQLGGHIRVYSEPGAGTVFKIYFPHAAEPATAPRLPTPVSGSAAAMPRTRGVTVLLVEDEASVRSVLRRNLERQGYSVMEAADGEAGLVAAAGHSGSIDILLTDIMMPGMNGRVFADRLRETRPDTRLVFMSGYTGETVSVRGLVDDGHAFLQKPFSNSQLLSALRDVLSAPANAAA